MKDKNKNILIAFLTLSSIILFVFLILSVNSNKDTESTAHEENQEQIVILKEQLQEYQAADNSDIIEKVNVCTNFLRTYYSVQHSKTKAAALPDCKVYLTDQLYAKLSPAEEETEYSQNDVDVDYTSSISIKNTYLDTADPNELIVLCTIKKTVNDMQSINTYFVKLKVESVDNQWLVSNFELISVQGG